MEGFSILRGVAASLPIENIDTDKIIPGAFLKTVRKDGLGRYLFWSWRSEPGFILEKAPWNQACILIAGSNFGCGSSREHAPWALRDFGFRCIIAPKIADIFSTNCYKNEILPIVIAQENVDRLAAAAADPARCEMEIDLEKQVIRADGEIFPFEIEEKLKSNLILGRDDIAETMLQEGAISRFEADRAESGEDSWAPGFQNILSSSPRD